MAKNLTLSKNFGKSLLIFADCMGTVINIWLITLYHLPQEFIIHTYLFSELQFGEDKDHKEGYNSNCC